MLAIYDDKQHDKRVALDDGCERYTWSELREQVAKSAQGLRNLQTSGTVMIEMTNTAEALIQLMSAFQAGWDVCPFSSKAKHSQVQRLVDTLQPQLMIAIQGNHTIPVYTQAEWRERYNLLKPYVEHQSTSHFVGTTSGTTGLPKILYRTIKSWQASSEALADAYHNEKVQTVIIPGKLEQGHFLMGAIDGLCRGLSVRLLSRYHPQALRQLIEGTQDPLVYIVPTMMQHLAELPTNTSGFWLCGGDHCQTYWQERLKTAAPRMRLWRYYGSMETSFISLARDTDAPDSVGFPMLGVNITLTTEQKISVRSNQLFSGYDSKEQHINQWETSDYGYLSEAGELTVIGRDTNRIQFGALTVQAEVVEAVLQQTENLDEVVVIGQNDAYWGEIVVAYYTGRATKKTLRQLFRHQLKAHERPRLFVHVAELPHTITGKIDRQKMKEEGIHEPSSHC